jgi:hypothetical protein
MKIHTTDSDQDLTFEVRLKVPVTEEQLDDFLLTAQCDYWSKTLRYNLRGVGGGPPLAGADGQKGLAGFANLTPCRL